MSEPIIKQLLPAPGWRALNCAVEDDGAATFMDVPFIGWGLYQDGEIAPIVWVENRWAGNIDEFDGSNYITVPVKPGQEVTDEWKQELTEIVRNKIQHEKERPERERLEARKKIMDLHKQGMSVDDIVLKILHGGLRQFKMYKDSDRDWLKAGVEKVVKDETVQL